MKLVSSVLVLALAATPALAQDRPSSIRSSAEKEATAAAAQSRTEGGRGAMFWAGLGLGIAGVTTAVLGVSVARVEDSSSGNAPAGTFQACIAQKSDPIYAGNSCDALKGKNLGMVWGGVAAGAIGAALMVSGSRTSAQVAPGAIRVLHTVRF
jgi:hypothetical protein